MIVIEDKEYCCGCEACSNACPIDAISMKPDEEGFLYPIVDKKKCINCSLCERVCPILSNDKIDEDTVAYAAQNIDEKARQESSSGGAFSAIADYVLRCGGVVFGATYDDCFDVRHVCIDDKSKLQASYGSKYVQSYIGYSYRKVKKALEEKPLVCFSGTPCQVEGLKKYLRHPYDNLLTIDVVCHGVPSPKVYDKYKKYLISKYGHFRCVNFRDKKYGYAGSTMSVRLNSGDYIPQSRELQFFKDSFFCNLSTRPSCYKCHFKTIERISDFTLFDCWHVGRWCKEMDDDLGTTLMLIHSKMGKMIFNEISVNLRFCNVPVSEAIEFDGDMAVKSIPNNIHRASFFADLDSCSLSELMDLYIPETFQRYIIFKLKPLIYKLKLLPFLKKILFK